MCGAGCGSIVPAMTETTSAPGPVGVTRTLYRDPDDGMFAGVCAAMARYTDTDPVIWRIVTVVLTVFGGTGAVLYLLGWLLIPKLGADSSIADSWLRRKDHRMGAKTMALIALAVIILIGGFDDSRGVAAVAILAFVGYLVHRERQGRPLAPSYQPSSDVPPPAPVSDGSNWTSPPPVVRAPRERSKLGLITLSVAALVSGVLAWAYAAGADGLTPARITAIALLIVGAGLVVGTWVGRARWLVAVGLLLCLGLGTAAAADATGGTLRGGVGNRTWVADETLDHQGYRLGIGEATLDLTALPADGRHIVVSAHVGLGHLIVLVPDGVPVRLHAKVRIGDITEYGKSLVDGTDNVERTRTYGPSGDPQVEVEATLGTGQVEVRHG
jgi:phage shock protein PspC (stress-responsive transcriptional regulator)